MAGAIIIACAIGVLLLVLGGYVLVSGTLASADSIGSAQKDVVQEKDDQVHTAIQLLAISPNPWEVVWVGGSDNHHLIHFKLKNIGSEPIGDFNRTDMFIALDTNNVPVRYSFNGSRNLPGSNASKMWGYTTITPDTTHPSMLDPGETMTVEIDFLVFGNEQHPTYTVNVITPNGVTNRSGI